MAHETDLVVALDRLQARAPKVETRQPRRRLVRRRPARRALPRSGPASRSAAKATTPRAGRSTASTRGAARVVSRVEGRPAYGGTPSDCARGAGDPGAEGARAAGDLLPVHPDGRARRQRPAGPVRPAPRRPADLSLARADHLLAGGGLRRHADKTAAAAAQVAAFFGSAAAVRLRRRRRERQLDRSAATGACAG